MSQARTARWNRRNTQPGSWVTASVVAGVLASLSGCGAQPSANDGGVIDVGQLDARIEGDGGPSRDSGEDAEVLLDADIPEDTDPRADSGPIVCTVDDFQLVCPTRPCETLVSCSASGACQYQPFACPTGGGECPQLTCQSSGSPADGDVSNRCVEVLEAPCGGGGRCEGAVCVESATGLRLRNGGLRVGRVDGEWNLSGGRLLTLRGHVGFVNPELSPQRSGRFQLTGGLRP